MATQFGMWIWPVTLADEGDTPLQQMRDLGVDVASVNIGIYAGYRLLLPCNAKRAIYSMEEGIVYFRPHAAHYAQAGFQPEPSEDFAGLDALEVACRAKDKTGLKISAWLPIFANGRLAKEKPELATENIFGSRDRLFLCLNNPQTRAFAHASLEDIVSNYEIDYLEIDKIPQTCIEEQGLFGRLEPTLRTIASMCFCSHCGERAESLGLDWGAAKERAKELALECLSTPRHLVNRLGGELRGDVGVPLLLLDEPLLSDVLRFRTRSTVEFLGEVREMVERTDREVKVLVDLVPPVKIGHDAAAPRAWLAAQSYRELSRAADGINSCIHWGPEEVWFELDQARKMIAGNCLLNAGLKIYADVSPKDVSAIGEAAVEGGADGIWFFSYDLANAEVLEAVGRFIASNR